MIKIWGRKDSANVQKVLWCCGELGLDYERVDVGGRFAGLDSAEYLSLNPNGLIPTVEDGATVVWESNAIIRYLSHKYGAGNLWPLDLPTLSVADRWMDWQLTHLLPGMSSLFFGLVKTVKARQDSHAIEFARDRAAASWSIFDQHISDRDYVTGASFSMGDVPLGVMAYRWFEMEIPRPDLPNLRRWYERLAKRPKFMEDVMQPLVYVR